MSVPVEFVNDRGNKVEIKDTEARRLASVAQTAAENAQSTATAAGTLAQQAKDIADAASSVASTNTKNINTLDGKVTALEGSVSDIEEDIETIKEDYISKEELQPYDILEETDNLPLTFTTNGESLIDYKIYGNSNSNHIDEVTNNLPITIPNAKAGIVEDWTIEGNNIPQVENITEELPLTFPSNGDNITDYTIYGNNNPSQPEPEEVLPLSFTTAETVLRDWTIYGNDDNGTENIVPPIRTANGWKQGYRQKSNGNYTTTYNNGEWLYDVYIPIDSTSFTFWATSISMQESATFYFFDNNKDYLINTAIDINTYNNTVISDLPANAAYMQFAFRTHCMSEQEIIDNNYQVMLVKGSTAPDHYIPYQKGVGQRTKNLFDITATSTTIRGVTFIVDKNAGTITANGTADSTVYLILPIDVPSGDYYYSGCVLGGSVSTYELYSWDNTINGRPKKWDGETTVDSDYGGTSQQIKVDSEHSMQLNIRIYSGYTCNNLVFKPMLRAADTDAEFIPYGYEVPLTVSQSGQTDKTYDIYIGSTPLTEGETVSKTSTGVDLELFEGENTVSTTLYNKPEMYCGMALGVGMPTENLLEITSESTVKQAIVIDILGDGTVSANGTNSSSSGNMIYEFCRFTTTEEMRLLLSGGAAGGSEQLYYLYAYDHTAGARPRQWDSTTTSIFIVDDQHQAEVLLPAGHEISIRFIVRPSQTISNAVFKPMLRLPGTSPDFEPYGYKVPITITDENSNTTERTFYIGSSRLLSGDTYTKTQAGINIPTTSGNNTISTTLYNKPEMNVVCNSNVLGVGERTANLFNKNATNTNNGYVTQSYIDIDGNVQTSSAWNVSEYIPISANTDYVYIWKLTSGTTQEPCLAIYDSTKTLIETKKYKDFDPDTIVPFTTSANAAFIRASWYNSYADQTMLTEGTTIPTVFIPYGYQLPITVTDSSNNSTPYTFQLGSQPLAQGQSISRSTTHSDITLYSGSNTISTSLNNKPNMFISYQSGELGVGVRTANLFDINASALVQIDAQETMRFGVSVGALKAGTYTLSFDKDSSSNYSFWIVERRGTTYTRSGSIASSPYTFTLSADADEVIAQTSYQRVTTWEALGLTNIMLVEGSTAPEDFIPYGYEIPIRVYDGEANTENTNYTDLNFYIGNSLLSADEYIDFINNKIYKYVSSVLTPTNPIVDLPVIPTNGTNTIDTTLYNKPEMYIKYSTDSFSRIFTTTLPTTFINHSDKVKDWIIYGNESGVGEEGNDGYIIPLVVNGNTINIPIGSAALTEGETVSRTSTNIDIPTIDGENTINTTLTNKPTMKITKDFVTKEYIEDVANSCMNDNVEDIVENVVDDKVDKQMFFMFYSSINKNGMFRGKDLTNVYTIDEIYQKVSSGDFDDLYLGDYFTKSITTDIYTKFTGSAFVEGTTYYTRTGTLNNWVYTETEDTSYDSSKTYYTKTTKTENVSLMIAHFNYYYNVGDTTLTNPHIILTNRNYGFATTSKMNPTNTTVGGYYNSEMHQTTLPCYAKSLKTALNNHLLSHKTLLSNAINASTPSMAGAGLTGASSSWAWVDTELQLMTEQQLFGSGIWTSSAYDVGCDGEKLAVFNFVNGVQNGRINFWLRSVASSAAFALCLNGGSAGYNSASYARYVRPLIVFG